MYDGETKYPYFLYNALKFRKSYQRCTSLLDKEKNFEKVQREIKYKLFFKVYTEGDPMSEMNKYWVKIQ